MIRFSWILLLGLVALIFWNRTRMPNVAPLSRTEIALLLAKEKNPTRAQSLNAALAKVVKTLREGPPKLTRTIEYGDLGPDALGGFSPNLVEILRRPHTARAGAEAILREMEATPTDLLSKRIRILKLAQKEMDAGMPRTEPPAGDTLIAVGLRQLEVPTGEDAPDADEIEAVRLAARIVAQGSGDSGQLAALYTQVAPFHPSPAIQKELESALIPEIRGDSEH